MLGLCCTRKYSQKRPTIISILQCYAVTHLDYLYLCSVPLWNWYRNVIKSWTKWTLVQGMHSSAHWRGVGLQRYLGADPSLSRWTGLSSIFAFLMGGLRTKKPKTEQFDWHKVILHTLLEGDFFFFSLEAIKLQTPHQREAKIIQGFLHLCQTTLADHRGLNKSASDKLTDMMTD